MANLAAWAEVDPLTVWQAACLWAGLPPTETADELPSEARAAVAPRLKMLSQAIVTGRLMADSTKNPVVTVGDYGASLVKRSALIVFAVERSQWPGFLFPPPPPRTVALSELRRLGVATEDSGLLAGAESIAKHQMAQYAEAKASQIDVSTRSEANQPFTAMPEGVRIDVVQNDLRQGKAAEWAIKVCKAVKKSDKRIDKGQFQSVAWHQLGDSFTTVQIFKAFTAGRESVGWRAGTIRKKQRMTDSELSELLVKAELLKLYCTRISGHKVGVKRPA